MKRVLAVMIGLGLAGAACSASSPNAESHCPRGTVVETSMGDVCVYHGEIVIETGFDCPPDFPVGHRRGESMICAGEELPDTILEPIFVDLDEEWRPVDPVALCEGGQELELRYVVGGGGLMDVGMAMMSQNGHAFFYLDGQCRYWVFPEPEANKPRWSDVRYGELTTAQAQALAEDLQLARWAELDGRSFGEAAPDASGQLYAFGDVSFTCVLNCSGSALAETIRESLRSRLSTLYADGTSLDGDQRVVLVEFGDRPAENYPARVAPEGLDLSRAIGAEDAAMAQNHCHYSFVVAGAVAQTLRSYRTEFREANPWYDFIPLEDDAGAKYQLYMRDVLPGEDGRGNLPGTDRSMCQ